MGVVRNGRAVLVPITIGRDYGSTVEVVSGLNRSRDAVILNPADSLISGTPVRVNPAQDPMKQHSAALFPPCAFALLLDGLYGRAEI